MSELARCSLRQTCRPHSVGAFAVGGSDRLGLLLISSLSRRPIKLTNAASPLGSLTSAETTDGREQKSDASAVYPCVARDRENL